MTRKPALYNIIVAELLIKQAIMYMAINTLQISKNLIKSGFNNKMAEAVAFELKDTGDNFLNKKEAKDTLATKSDVNTLKIEMSHLSNKIILWISGLLISSVIGLAFLIVKTIA